MRLNGKIKHVKSMGRIFCWIGWAGGAQLWTTRMWISSGFCGVPIATIAEEKIQWQGKRPKPSVELRICFSIFRHTWGSGQTNKAMAGFVSQVGGAAAAASKAAFRTWCRIALTPNRMFVEKCQGRTCKNESP
eukprot:10094805-Karenia_brevis.AAC.1